MLKRAPILVAAVALVASAGGCTIGSGSGAATGPLWILGCLDGLPKGTPDAPEDFDLEPSFFAGEPIEDIGTPPVNRLIILIKRNGNAVEINDTLYFDIRDSAQVARCIRGRTVGGAADWDTSTGSVDPTITMPWCVPAATMGELPQIRLVPFGPVAVSFQPLASCHSSMHPPAIVDIAGVAQKGYITFSDFGGAMQSDQANTPPDQRDMVDPTFKVNYGARLRATFQFTVEDERVAAAIRDKVVLPSPPVIGGMLSGNFDFDFERGRSAQTFP